MIYLNNAGTTKMFDECVEIHREFSCNQFFNPSALSIESMQTYKQIVETEKYILKRLGVTEGNILFTGCATESNNLAIKGSLRSGNWEYVFSEGEHPSVYNVAKKLEMEGYKVHFVPLQSNGCVDYDELEKVVNEKTRLISIIHVGNETGAINNLEKISKIKLKYCPRAILHIDGVQGFMKIPFSLKQTAVDLYSFSGHKFHAPKGIAGLYVKNKGGLKEFFQGGGQQYGLRSGTENVSGIMQLRKAVEMIDEKVNFEKVSNLKSLFNSTLQSDENIGNMGNIENVEVALKHEKRQIKNLDANTNEVLKKIDIKQLNQVSKDINQILIKDFGGSPYIENLIFQGVKGETMLHALNKKGVIVGLGSACSSKKAGNRVLDKIGLNADEIISSVRISFNAYMSEDEVVKAGNIIKETYQEIKEKVL